MVVPYCGDGEFQEPEQCDAGEGNSNVEPDACRTNCREAYCGDGVQDSGEACDDGNANEYDGCTWACELSMCGNGVIEPLEECDIGDANSNTEPNTCRAVCRKPWCGDGIIDAGEECDFVQRANGDGCSNECQLLCPPEATKIQGRCLILKAAAEECGIFCTVGNVWEGFVDWLFGLFA